MDKKYLTFDSQEGARAFVDLTSTSMGYVPPKSYTYIKQTINGKYACLTCPLCHEYMTQAQKDSLVSVDYANVNFWPVQEEVV